jgi:uncharacterized protein (TIGR01777 family)
MRIAITGASGLIGGALVPALKQAGDEVLRIGRQAPAELLWNPSGQIDPGALEGVEAVVHLAGETVAGRWNENKKSRILNSRARGTETIAMALARMKTPPRVLVSASAIGYYGSRGDEVVDEESASGTGFLAEVARQWEAATKPAAQAGVRVVTPRIGVVLAKHGGALPKMLPAFRLGLGGVVGSGRQWWSWISLRDVVSAIQSLIRNSNVSGPVNLVSQNPVTNLDFTKAMARVLRRPALFPLPEGAVKFFFGEMGVETLLSSQRVRPKRLEEMGFRFQLPELQGALRAELG